MTSFDIFLRKSGEDKVKVEVTPQTTLAEIKTRSNLKGYALCFKGNRKDTDTIASLGIEAGGMINACKTGGNASYQAARRIKMGKASGGTVRSTAHPSLHAQTQAVVIDAVMSEGDQTRRDLSTLAAAVQQNLQARPDQLQMMADLCGAAVSTLNAVLTKAGIVCKGSKALKAKCLVEKVPVHELQKLLAEARNPSDAASPASSSADDTAAGFDDSGLPAAPPNSTAAAAGLESDSPAEDSTAPGVRESGGSEAAMENSSVCELRKQPMERGGRKFTEITHVFKEGHCPAGYESGAEFGVKQYVGIFTEEELRSFEQHADGMMDDDEQWLANTLDVSPAWATGDKKYLRTRTKYFFPKYDYSGGKTPKRGDCAEVPLPPGQKCPDCKGAQALYTENCNNIPFWIYHESEQCLASVLINVGILKNAWATSAILNVYHKAGGKLGQHFDSPHLFARPIIGISLFGDKQLAFGVKTQGMQNEDFHYAVDMPRGAVTVMYGYAANKINHAVKPVPHKAATLLIRRMHPSLLGEEWCARNFVTVKRKISVEPLNPEAKKFKAASHGTSSTASTSPGCSLPKLPCFSSSCRASSNGSVIDLDDDEP